MTTDTMLSKLQADKVHVKLHNGEYSRSENWHCELSFYDTMNNGDYYSIKSGSQATYAIALGVAYDKFYKIVEQGIEAVKAPMIEYQAPHPISDDDIPF